MRNARRDDAQSKALVPVRNQQRLPDTAKGLRAFILIKEDKFNLYRVRLRSMKEARLAQAQIEVTRRDMMNVGELLFESYEREGELVKERKALPKDAGKMGGRGRKGGSTTTTLSTIKRMAKELKVSYTQLEQYQLLSENRQYRREAFKLARKDPTLDPPSKTSVLRAIREGLKGDKEGKSARSEESKSVTQECTERIREVNLLWKQVIIKWEETPQSEQLAFVTALDTFKQNAEELERQRLRVSQKQLEVIEEERNTLTEEKKGA